MNGIASGDLVGWNHGTLDRPKLLGIVLAISGRRVTIMGFSGEIYQVAGHLLRVVQRAI